jgi:hypothetical protein
MLQECKRIGGKENQIVYWSRPLDGNNQTLTPNPDSIYFMAFYNTKDGPIAALQSRRGNQSDFRQGGKGGRCAFGASFRCWLPSFL